MLPARVQVPDVDARALADQVNQAVHELLTEAGIDFVPVADYIAYEQEIAATLGGSFDIYTGEQDVEKAKTINELAIREFERKEQFDAYLIPGIVRVNAPYNANVARWDGIERQAPGKKTGFLSGGGEFRGYLPAASAMITLIDKTEADKGYYIKRGGIELLAYTIPNIMGSIKLRMAPLESRLQDDALNREGLSIAIAPLLAALNGETAGEAE